MRFSAGPFIILALVLSTSFSNAADITRANPAVDDFNPYNDAYEEQRASAARELKPEEARNRAVALESRLDEILEEFRNKSISLQQAVKFLLAPETLRGTGYVLIEVPADKSIVGQATDANSAEWNKAMGGTVSAPDQLPNGLKIAGEITIMVPIVRNGADIFHPSNQHIALQFLRVIAEEHYHVVQQLKGFKAERAISHYFKTASGSELRNLRSGYWYEADVYAKIMENLGTSLVPSWYEDSYPEDRRKIDRARIQVRTSGKERRCSALF